jgi:putative hydrolase of the HAD superfamily
MLRAVAFDLGGVLVDVDHRRACRGLGVALATWKDAWFSGTSHVDVSCGRIDPEAFIATGAVGLRCSPERARTAWQAVVEVWPGAFDLVAAIEARGLRVLVWSNTDPVHVEKMKQALPWLASAHGLSYRLGRQKPEAAYYHAALEPDLAPGEVLFVDDRIENVTAAAAAGIHAVHINSATESNGLALTQGRLHSALDRVAHRG